MKTDEKLNEAVMKNLANANCIGISFDTTGSMSPCIAAVRENIKQWLRQLFKTVPNLKIAFIAHGDYCDGPKCITEIDFTDDQDKLATFVNDAPDTGGGDVPECYELVLNHATRLSWPKEGGAFVMIGDATPHEPNYSMNTDHIDWREELKKLKEKNVQVFALQCLRNEGSAESKFWESVAEKSGSDLMLLENFEQAAMTLGAVAAATGGEESLREYGATLCCLSDTSDEEKSVLRGATAKLARYAASRSGK